ncbi:putative membrane protein, partial [Phenoliferia sp. Uapishka_3]
MSIIIQKITSYFSTPTSEGYQPIQSYGTVTPTAANGLQSLPADASKIEPKVWLASERTFLNWLRVSILISSFALALFNGAAVGDKVAKGMGLTYAVISIGMLGYAWTMQEKRRHRIITRFGGHHDEIYGPIVICAVIFLAVLVNFILRVNQREALRNHPTPKNPWLVISEQVQSAFVVSW